MKTRLSVHLGLFLPALMSSTAWAASNVSFSQPVETVEAYDYVEVTLHVDKPEARNPFLDVAVTGSFSKTDGSERKTVEGFCDSGDGTLFRIRFMPASPGDYTWSATYRQGAAETTHTGAFKASAGQRKGPIRVDPKYPWHFIWEGAGEHYFFNGTTAFWLMGWRDERTINNSIDRLRQLKINRLRVPLCAGPRCDYLGDSGNLHAQSSAGRRERGRTALCPLRRRPAVRFLEYYVGPGR